MSAIYKLVKKVVVAGKKKSVYRKKGTQKLYVKSKGRMMNLVKYKKMKAQKSVSKPKKIKRKRVKRRGGGNPLMNLLNGNSMADDGSMAGGKRRKKAKKAKKAKKGKK